MQIVGYHVWRSILLLCVILQATAVISRTDAKSGVQNINCSGLWKSSRNDVIHASKPGNVKIVQKGTSRHFKVTFTRTAPPTDVPYYFVLIGPAEPSAIARSSVCFAVKNDRENFEYASRLALNDQELRLKENTTIRVTVTSSLSMRRDTYSTFLVRIPYPPPGKRPRIEFIVLPPEAGYKSLLHWSTPVTMSLGANCTLVVGFIEAPQKMSVPKYRVSLLPTPNNPGKPLFLLESHSPATFRNVLPGTYEIQLMPHPSIEDKARGRCLCRDMGRCWPCLALTSTPIVILPDNTTKGGCLALPEPSFVPKAPPIVEATSQPDRQTASVVPVTVVVVLFFMMAIGLLMGFIWMLHRSGKRHMTYLIGDRGNYEALLIHSKRDRRLARGVCEWLRHTRKIKLRTKMVTVCGHGLFEPSVADLCYHLEHVRFVIILSSPELREEMETESPKRHLEFIKTLKLKFKNLNDNSRSVKIPDGRKTCESRLEQMFSLTIDISENHVREVFPRIVPYLIPHHVTEIAALVRSDVPIDDKRVKKMGQCIYDVYEERERELRRAADQIQEEDELKVEIHSDTPTSLTQNGRLPHDGNGRLPHDGNGRLPHDGNGRLPHDGNGRLPHDGNGPAIPSSNGTVYNMNILSEEPSVPTGRHDNRYVGDSDNNSDPEQETLLVRGMSEIST